jgi:polysaccharide biosynthesis protein PslH
VRVLFLTHRLPYAPNRGDRIRAFHILRVLARSHDVDLVSLVHDDDEAAQVPLVASHAVRVWPSRVRRWRNLLRAPFALPGHQPMTHVLLDSPAADNALSQITKTAPPDVVLAYCSGMARLAVEPPLSHYPMVLDMVDVDSEKWTALGASSKGPMRYIYRREARCLRSFERQASQAAVTTTVVNERERVAMLQVNPGARVEVAPNGIDLDAFRNNEAPSLDAQVIFCGVFSYEPNEVGALWLAREVWPRVKSARPDATLALVGMGAGRRLTELTADASIKVTGAVPDVRPYLWSSAVAAAPLHVARGIQNKVLEALAAGLPCVVTPAVGDGLPANVRSGCDVAADPDSFARAILEMLALPQNERRRRADAIPLDTLGWDEQLQPLMAALETAAARTTIP